MNRRKRLRYGLVVSATKSSTARSQRLCGIRGIHELSTLTKIKTM